MYLHTETSFIAYLYLLLIKYKRKKKQKSTTTKKQLFHDFLIFEDRGDFSHDTIVKTKKWTVETS